MMGYRSTDQKIKAIIPHDIDKEVGDRGDWIRLAGFDAGNCMAMILQIECLCGLLWRPIQS